jgi:hypothetical protein
MCMLKLILRLTASTIKNVLFCCQRFYAGFDGCGGSTNSTPNGLNDLGLWSEAAY